MPWPAAVAESRSISLQRRFVGLLVAVVVLFAAGMASSVFFSLRANDAAEDNLLDVEARQTQASIMRRWNYYREVADNLARDQELIDLMLLGAIDENQQWADARRRLLPGILGLALTDAAGELYGDAAAQRVGPSCLRDLRQQGVSSASRVLIHRDRPGMEHFDLIAVVRDASDTPLGKVFISVKLERLQSVLDDSTRPGHSTQLVDASGMPVAASGQVQGEARERRLPLADIGWTLIVRAPVSRLGSGDAMQILVGVLTLLGILALLVLAVLRMRVPVMQEIDAVRDALTSLTHEQRPPPIETRYSELEPVVADINRIAGQLHHQREQLERLSLTDALTGLPNRRALEIRFPQMLGLARRGHPIALVLLDVDDFKSINDRLGHAAGDQALIALATALKAVVRSADTAARLAGDEFVVLLSGVNSAGMATWHARLSDRFRTELSAAGLALTNSLSAGQAWLADDAGETLGETLARADQALYQAKAQGRGHLVSAPGMKRG